MTWSYTENVAMATVMFNINRGHKELSNSATTKFLNYIEVQIKLFERSILKYTLNGCHKQQFLGDIT